MKSNIKIPLMLLVASQLFLAALCDRFDDGPSYESMPTKVTVTVRPDFSVGDTLWINGKASNMVGDAMGDSIVNSNEFVQDIISVMRLRAADQTSNTIQAINEFDLLADLGTIDFLGRCPESDLIVQGPFKQSVQEYEYRIGFIPKNTGDFVLSWQLPINLKNTDLNVEILENYPINGGTNELGVTSCGTTSSIIDVKGSKDEFFFSVN